MNKRKIILVAMSLCMVAILVTGGSLAYFFDADAKTNVFTVGNVQIDLKEDYQQESILVPVTYEEDGVTRRDDNVVNKDVYVTNTGSEPCFVRVHIAIPSILDSGDPEFDAGKNVLHFNAEKESYQNGFWNWGVSTAANDALEGNAMLTGDWNYYETTIDNIPYNVYVVTYESILTKDATTLHYALSQVYLDKNVTNGDITKIKEGYTKEDGTTVVGLNENWKVYVAAEGAQAKGFTDAFNALNTTFGVPGGYNVEWEAVKEYVDENPTT